MSYLAVKPSNTASHIASASSWQIMYMGVLLNYNWRMGYLGKAYVWGIRIMWGVKERFQGQGKDVGKVGVCVINEGK